MGIEQDISTKLKELKKQTEEIQKKINSAIKNFNPDISIQEQRKAKENACEAIYNGHIIQANAILKDIQTLYKQLNKNEKESLRTSLANGLNDFSKAIDSFSSNFTRALKDANLAKTIDLIKNDVDFTKTSIETLEPWRQEKKEKQEETRQLEQKFTKSIEQVYEWMQNPMNKQQEGYDTLRGHLIQGGDRFYAEIEELEKAVKTFEELKGKDSSYTIDSENLRKLNSIATKFMDNSGPKSLEMMQRFNNIYKTLGVEVPEASQTQPKMENEQRNFMPGFDRSKQGPQSDTSSDNGLSDTLSLSAKSSPRNPKMR